MLSEVEASGRSHPERRRPTAAKEEAQMPKLDLKKELKHLYFPSATEPVIVDVPTMNFLMVDGEGDPNTSEEFQDVCTVLYGVSYTLKFMLKKAKKQDYVVMPLEGLWWADDMADFMGLNKDKWKWTLMIAQPDFVTAEQVDEAMKELDRRKNPPALPRLRFESYDEGMAAQILHIGPYAEEGPTIEKLHQFIRESGHEPRGKHHEIYMSDPRRTAPEKLKTVIRQPVQ
jgi:hypothetical protein